jgi:DNA replication ATP-dependent helicase Dna2
VEVLTIDKYQGRDKQCILLSFVRNNAARAVGGLLTDWQRVNVALTRAKHKMIMLGGSRTLGEVPLLAAMLGMLHSGGGLVLPIPPDFPANCAAADNMAAIA